LPHPRRRGATHGVGRRHGKVCEDDRACRSTAGQQQQQQQRWWQDGGRREAGAIHGSTPSQDPSALLPTLRCRRGEHGQRDVPGAKCRGVLGPGFPEAFKRETRNQLFFAYLNVLCVEFISPAKAGSLYSVANVIIGICLSTCGQGVPPWEQW